MFALGLLARLSVIFRHDGLRGFYGYDAAVYFAAGDALVHGRLPYHGFVLLHPPGLMLVLAPFAALGRWISDSSAFALADLAFCVLGALSAVLVVRVGRALGLRLRAAAIGGLFYALWYGSVDTEYLTKLEPLGSFVFLGGLLLTVRSRAVDSTRGRVVRALAGGALLGAAVSVKIWWIVPVLGVLLWHALAARRHGVKSPLLPLAGAVAGALVINLPFFLASPSEMWHSVVLDQIGRAQSHTTRAVRFADFTGATKLRGHVPIPVIVVLALLFLVVFAFAMTLASTVPAGRPVLGLFVVQALVLFAAPSWFAFYVDYLAPTASLVVAAACAADGVPRWARRVARPVRLARWAPTVLAAVVTVAALGLGAGVVGRFPSAPILFTRTAHVRCLMSDSPMSLIRFNALSRDLANGCPNWVDVTGRTYFGPDLPKHGESRAHNVRWQRDLVAYLRSGDAVVLVRQAGTGINRTTLHALARDGVLVRANGVTVYRVTSGP